MSIPVELDRKVRQLDNDVQAIYVMLADISATQRRQGNRLDELAAKQAEQDVKLDQLATVQGEQGAKLDEQGAKLDTIIELLRSSSS